MKPSLKNIMFEQTPGGGEQACHVIYKRETSQAEITASIKTLMLEDN